MVEKFVKDNISPVINDFLLAEFFESRGLDYEDIDEEKQKKLEETQEKAKEIITKAVMRIINWLFFIILFSIMITLFFLSYGFYMFFFHKCNNEKTSPEEEKQKGLPAEKENNTTSPLPKQEPEQLKTIEDKTPTQTDTLNTNKEQDKKENLVQDSLTEDKLKDIKQEQDSLTKDNFKEEKDSIKQEKEPSEEQYDDQEDEDIKENLEVKI